MSVLDFKVLFDRFYLDLLVLNY